MHIDKYEEAMMNCRFCFMCRHLSTIGQVRCTEVDTPRIRAAMLYGLKTGTNSFDDSDFVDALYRQELSACCTHHCVNHYDENGLALAARADVVEAGKAPEAVKKLAAKFAKSVGWKAEGSGDVGARREGEAILVVVVHAVVHAAGREVLAVEGVHEVLVVERVGARPEAVEHRRADAGRVHLGEPHVPDGGEVPAHEAEPAVHDGFVKFVDVHGYFNLLTL